jgi:chorismate mutase
MSEKYYIIKDNALPEIMHKVLEVQQLLQSGQAKTIKEATLIVGISRSVFYKYQDAIEPFFENEAEATITIGFNLLHMPGVLSNALNLIASYDINVLTINQTIPINSVAHVMITMETNKFSKDLSTLLSSLEGITGMRQLTVIGRSRNLGF